MMCNHVQSVAISSNQLQGLLGVNRAHPCPNMVRHPKDGNRAHQNRAHQLSLIAFLMEKVISDAIREAMRKAITVRMEKVISDAIREAIRKAITVRMVKVDGGIARPDPPLTCLAHLIIDDHAYVAYPWAAVGCWARAHAVRSVRLPQSEAIHTCPLEKLAFTLPAIEPNSTA